MANLKLENVTKRFGRIEAVNGLDLEVNDGEFFCVLGPPGAGKTTMLRLIVGLERPDEGMVYINGVPSNDVHPGKRDIAMVFQNLALYPDKTVYDNMAYPLRERRLPRAEIEIRVKAAARTLRIDHLLSRKPAKLSGGERQRVALGRAIVRQPQAYLMDEPLANLDALLRLEMRVELKRLQAELGETLVYVTHDQVEAMSMADRIAVLNHGRLQQVGIPDVIYNLPANRFVATVVGSPPTNFIPVEMTRRNGDLLLVHPAFALRAAGERHPLRAALADAGRTTDDGGPLPGRLGSGDAHQPHVGSSSSVVHHPPSNAGPDQFLVAIRPEDIQVFPANPGVEGIPAHVSVIEPLGSEIIVDLHLGPHLIKAVVPPAQRLVEGQQVWLKLDADRIHIFDVQTEDRLYTTGQAEKLDCLGRVPA